MPLLEPTTLARAMAAPATMAAEPPTKLAAVCRADATAVTVAAATRITAALTGASFLTVDLKAAVSLKPIMDLQQVPHHVSHNFSFQQNTDVCQYCGLQLLVCCHWQAQRMRCNCRQCHIHLQAHAYNHTRTSKLPTAPSTHRSVLTTAFAKVKASR